MRGKWPIAPIGGLCVVGFLSCKTTSVTGCDENRSVALREYVGKTENRDNIGRDSEHYAKLFTQRIFSAAEMLALFPESGRIVPEYDRRDLCELLFQNYRIVYASKEAKFR